jgi:hypothetical protein
MIMRYNLLKAVLGLIFAAAVVAPLSANNSALLQKVKQQAAARLIAPVSVPVDLVGQYTTTYVTSSSPGRFKLLQSSTTILDSGNITSTQTNIVAGQYYMKPGMAYDFYVSGTRIANFSMHFQPPTGYSVFIENIERQRFASSGNQYIKVRLMANDSLPAGEAAAPQPGRVLWSVGLGQLKNGDPAGNIQIGENDLTASIFTPSALFYDHENPDVSVVKSGGVLRQVYANECLADIQAINGYSYWIRFWSRSAVIYGQNGDGTWRLPIDLGNGQWENPNEPGQYVSPPFVAYKVENPVYPSVNRIKITRTYAVDGTRTSWTELRKSGATWTLLAWNTGTYPITPHSQTVVTYSDTDKKEQISIQDGSGNVCEQYQNTYTDFSWGRELTKVIHGYGQATTSVCNQPITDSVR